MEVLLNFPTTNLELAEMGGGQQRFPASTEEFWEVLAEAEYRADYFDHQIIATMSYETNIHSLFATRMTTLWDGLFSDSPEYQIFNSNRPGFIEDCAGTVTGVFNADGMVVRLPQPLHEYRPGMNAETNPTVLVEVLSPSTREYDFNTKLPCCKSIESLQHIIFLETSEPRVFFYEKFLEKNGAADRVKTEFSQASDVLPVSGQGIALKKIDRGIYF